MKKGDAGAGEKDPGDWPAACMDISNLITEEDILKGMWVTLAQWGVVIDNIDDDGEVWFTVPSESDYMVRAQMMIPGVDTAPEEQDMMMAGELLRAIASNFFEENGLVPHGGIRDQHWFQISGQVRAYQEQDDIKKEGPTLLRV